MYHFFLYTFNIDITRITIINISRILSIIKIIEQNKIIQILKYFVLFLKDSFS